MQLQLENKIISVLKKEGFENPILESKLLCNHLFNSSCQNQLKNIDIFENHLNKHLYLIKKKVPIQRQLGFTIVNKLKFQITKDVLLPGPEIETLIHACLDNLTTPKRLIDLCTGSGVVAIVLGKKFKQANIIATDISEKALKVAKINARLNNINNINFLRSNLFQSISNEEINKVDLIVSNPPYCRSKDIAKLPPQIKLFTPRIAIDGGPDGLFFHKIIIDQSKNYLRKNGFLVLENEVGQSRILQSLLINSGYRVIKIYKNDENEERVIVAKKTL